MELLSGGLVNREIAVRLGISEQFRGSAVRLSGAIAFWYEADAPALEIS